MMKLMKEAVEAPRELSEDRQEKVAHAILDYASSNDDVYHLTADERMELPAGLAEVDQGEIASDAEVAAASAVGPEKPAATPKKAKKTAKRQNQRRDPYWYGAPSWREVEYQRGGYGRGGFTPNFW